MRVYFSVRKRAKGKGRNRRYKRANSSPRKSGVQKHVEGSGAGEVPKAARQGLNNGWGLLISAGLADVSLSSCLSTRIILLLDTTLIVVKLMKKNNPVDQFNKSLIITYLINHTPITNYTYTFKCLV